jgi:hypothetical protein
MSFTRTEQEAIVHLVDCVEIKLVAEGLLEQG